MKRILVLMLAVLALGTAASCTAGKDAASCAAKHLLFGEVMSADDAFAAAKKGGAVVFEGAVCVAGKDIWNEFYAKVQNGEPASVLCATYYTLYPEKMTEEAYEAEKDRYPQLYFTLLEYDGRVFSYATRLSSDESADDTGEYPYLMHYTGELNPQAAHDYYDYYVLVNDPNATWEKIEHGMFSSMFGRYIPHKMVYTDMFD